MSAKENDYSVDERSTTSSINVDLNDHRNHTAERENRSAKTTGTANNSDGKSGGRRGSSIGRPRALSFSKITPSMAKHTDQKEDGAKNRRGSRASVNSANSVRSRESQETEEDVWFPMEQKQVKINGIDFGVINEFIDEERNLNHVPYERSFSVGDNHFTPNDKSRMQSSASLKYTPSNVLKSIVKRPVSEEEPGAVELSLLNNREGKSDSTSDESCFEGEVKFGGAQVTSGANGSLPNRFSLFHSESEETVHAPDIPSLVPNGESVQELFHNGEETWWLDCTCPTDAEMKMLAKAFGIHPLTAEDIRMQEPREKVELFRNYYFVCFHGFESDRESEDYLEPINVYVVVFRDGILTFHFSPMAQPANVRRRVRQLRDYVDVTADWLCYAVIDDITDSFAPIIQDIEYEADAIEDSVFTSRDTDFSSMLQKIGESRRKVMTLMRLLSGKADVIKMFAKRCQDEGAFGYKGAHWRVGQEDTPPSPDAVNASDNGNYSKENSSSNNQSKTVATNVRPRADIALYLGDIQDHIITMLQNLNAYERILSRSHSNYLGQLQCESLGENNKVTQLFSKVTILGTMLIPLNLVTGLFGMNVTVPGKDADIAWFWGILGVLLLLLISSVFVAHWWMERMKARIDNQPRPVFSARKSFRNMRMRGFDGRSVNSVV
ncbi:ALR1 [Candida metapsilosis]|uniref:ALR1 n=1 Tax=Candida metapsilosis TaxID=273372 RepID=A0A8H7ZL42_9ASCO|nr:ALR1 [Candida metapsilosis]